jgi:hypothetical protein
MMKSSILILFILVPETVPKALRELLPKQADINELAAMLRRLPSSASSGLPEPVRVSVWPY